MKFLILLIMTTNLVLTIANSDKFIKHIKKQKTVKNNIMYR